MKINKILHARGRHAELDRFRCRGRFLSASVDCDILRQAQNDRFCQNDSFRRKARPAMEPRSSGASGASGRMSVSEGRNGGRRRMLRQKID